MTSSISRQLQWRRPGPPAYLIFLRFRDSREAIRCPAARLVQRQSRSQLVVQMIFLRDRRTFASSPGPSCTLSNAGWVTVFARTIRWHFRRRGTNDRGKSQTRR
nr:hypothetical protein CFP56_09981 [Quercus suber]